LALLAHKSATCAKSLLAVSFLSKSVSQRLQRRLRPKAVNGFWAQIERIMDAKSVLFGYHKAPVAPLKFVQSAPKIR
jgi:hypothetical protein